MNIKSLGVRKQGKFAGLAPAVTEALRCPRSAAGADILAPWAEAASCWAVGMHVLRAAGHGGMKGKASAKVPRASPGGGGTLVALDSHSDSRPQMQMQGLPQRQSSSAHVHAHLASHSPTLAQYWQSLFWSEHSSTTPKHRLMRWPVTQAETAA